MQGAEVVEIESYQKTGLEIPSLNQRYKEEKACLALAVKRGELVKEVDRDLYRQIPNEYYIIHSQGCPFDCQYCFLYDYLNHQVPTIFVNIEDILDRIRELVASNPQEQMTFHTGEFSDALAFDHITNLSRPLVELFAGFDNAFLELRTKSDNIQNLIGLEHGVRSIVSWTFTPERAVQLFEYHTATLAERIAAAHRCQNAGYKVALRFDPIVRYPGWEEGYRSLVYSLGEALDPALISDCHLGMLRFTPGLGRIIRERFPNSWLRGEETVPCRDGKYRYFKPLRLDMYRQILGWLNEVFPGLNLDLCMDSPEVIEALAGHLRQ